MSNGIKLVAFLGLVVTLAACGGPKQEDDYVAVQPEPISSEPAYTGKYK